MDTITHALFGLTTFGMLNKKDMPKNLEKALLYSSVTASLIPDIDFLTRLTEKGSTMYQMWHRGLSHSFFMVPIWSILIFIIASYIWKIKDKRLFFLIFLNVLIHIIYDSFNGWGTGLFEPFSSQRISIGIIPIIDVVFWGIFLVGFLFKKYKKHIPTQKIWRIAWLVLIFYVGIKGAQGFIINKEASKIYEKHELTAGFLPWQFTVVGKSESIVEIRDVDFATYSKLRTTIESKDNVDLKPLFEQNPKAEVLYKWSPFVVVVDNEHYLGIYDPRFYREGEGSFLYEFIEKK